MEYQQEPVDYVGAFIAASMVIMSAASMVLAVLAIVWPS
jgi:hypothetical protein